MIIILGPGRCGTSTVARLLHNNLKISMGAHFREPDSSNPQGFYEDLNFRDLNHAMLNGQCNNFEFKLDYFINSRKEPFGIKDPRICHLWQCYQRYDAQYIVCTRRPQLIIKSLMANYGWSEVECKQLLSARLNGIDKLLEGRDALRIDFSSKRTDSELTNLLTKWIKQ